MGHPIEPIRVNWRTLNSKQHVQSGTITEHLKRYGIRTFSSDEYWYWAGKRMGRSKAAKVDKLREPVVEGQRDDPASLRRFYDFIADPEVYGPVTSQQADDVAQALRAITSVVDGRTRILDLGCSIGHMTTWLALQDPDRQVTGVDISPRMVREAARHATMFGIRNTQFVQGDLNEFVPEGPFDAVIDAATLQYVDDLVGVLIRLREQMAPNGILVSVPQLGRARDAMSFLAALKYADFGVRSFSFVYASGLGRNVARPCIVAGVGGETIHVDLTREFETAKEVLASGPIRTMSEIDTGEP
jgi:2-polyprenyl-3-methyl-5-hydroxy-6-metoxy-1,4-benzoquinol methylase